MKRHRQEPILVVPEEPEVVIGSEAMERVASEIESDILSRLDDGDIELTEAAGHLSMATLLQQIRNGELTDKDAAKFLMDLAIKKTANPIQRIEERQQIDLRITFQDIISENPDRLAATLEQARKRNDEVRTRLQLSANMELAQTTNQQQGNVEQVARILVTTDQTRSDESLSYSKQVDGLAESTPLAEPIEIDDLRRGGDGSRRKIDWETALDRDRRLKPSPPLPEQEAE